MRIAILKGSSFCFHALRPLLFVVLSIALFAPSTQALTKGTGYSLKKLELFNHTLLKVKEDYVDPARIKPQEMLRAVLKAVEREVPEVMAKVTEDDIELQVAKKTKKFSSQKVISLWGMSFLLKDIFEFIDASLPKSIDRREIEYAAVGGMLSVLDPHSRFLDPKFTQEIQASTDGEFGGCGFSIGIRDGFLTVVSLFENAPAKKAGVKAGDRVLKIGEDSTINMSLDEAISKLRGDPDTVVKLTVLHKGDTQTKQLNIVREIIRNEAVSSKMLEGGILYVRLTAFQSNAANEVKEAIDAQLEKAEDSVRGVILDLYDNPGGLYAEGVALANLFLEEGVIVITQGASKENREEERASVQGEKYGMPLVILLNSGSASSSEIVAGALRDRALIIGEQSFGKGSVQRVYRLPYQSSLKLTEAQYLTPGEESIQSVGITPDVELLPMSMKDPHNPNLFPDAHMSESDLEAHLTDKRVAKRQAFYKLHYVFSEGPEKEDPEEILKPAESSTSYQARLAQAILRRATDAKRSTLIKVAGEVIQQYEEEENKELEASLRKFNLDWSRPVPGEEKKAGEISMRLLKAASAKAGSVLRIDVEVINKGDAPLWRVYALSKSPTGFLSDRELVFGKISPRKNARFSLQMQVPKEVLTRRDTMRLTFYENSGKVLGSLDVPVVIEGREHPIFAYRAPRILNVSGQAQESIAVGEEVSLLVPFKNVGNGQAQSPIVLLKNLSGSDVFIVQGRQELKPIEAGEEAQAQFRFTVKKSIKTAKLELHFYDAVMGDYFVTELNFPVLGKDKDILKLEKVSADESSFRSPPRVTLLPGVKRPVVVAATTYRLPVQVHSEGALKDVILFVNNDKYYYNALDSKGPSDVAFTANVSLKPGINVINVIARADEKFMQRESLVVFSTKGDPYDASTQLALSE